jgi:hypothetical protein
MECQERFCHGLIAVHFRAQRRQTRKNSRQKEEEKIQILPANGKLHQTRKLVAIAAAQCVVETGFQLQISRDKIRFRFLLLFFFFSFCYCCSCCCCALGTNGIYFQVILILKPRNHKLPSHTHTQYPQPNKKERKKNLLSSRKKETQAGTNKTSQNVTDKT